ELTDSCRNCCKFSLFLGFLLIEGRKLRALLGGLIDQKLPLHCNQPGFGSLGWKKGCDRIALTAQGRIEPRNVELCGSKVASQVFAFRVIHRCVKLDQDLANLHALPIANPDRTYYTGLERLDDLGTTARNNLAGG